ARSAETSTGPTAAMLTSVSAQAAPRRRPLDSRFESGTPAAQLAAAADAPLRGRAAEQQESLDGRMRRGMWLIVVIAATFVGFLVWNRGRDPWAPARAALQTYPAPDVFHFVRQEQGGERCSRMPF